MTEIHANSVVVRNLTGKHAGQTSYIPKCKLIDDSGTFPFQLVRVQFPLRLCYAMTINKSQLDKRVKRLAKAEMAEVEAGVRLVLSLL